MTACLLKAVPSVPVCVSVCVGRGGGGYSSEGGRSEGRPPGGGGGGGGLTCCQAMSC